MLVTRKLQTGILIALLAIWLQPTEVRSGHVKSNIERRDIVTGEGPETVRHSKVSVHYTGWLANGTKFDSSLDRGTPFQFTLGTGQVIPGWDMGLTGMKAGGKRKLVIPPELAYGKKGAGAVIPPNSVLTFEVELLRIVPPKYQNIDNAELSALMKHDVKIIDIRRADEWRSTGIIKGSKLLTAFDGKGNFVKNFAADFKSLVRQDEKVILICRSGNRTATIANFLSEKANFGNVLNVQFGIKQWIKRGHPVVKWEG